MSEKEYHKCNREQGLCPSLRDRTKSLGDRGAGFFALQVLDLSQMVGQASITLKGVIYKTDAKDRGLALNLCPFCGERIDWFRNNE